MKATIKITSLNDDINIFANDETNKFIVNGKCIKTNVTEFIGQLAIITSNWEPFYGDPSIVDGAEFIVELTGKTNRRYIGSNDFPLNYDKFTNLIMGVINKCN